MAEVGVARVRTESSEAKSEASCSLVRTPQVKHSCSRLDFSVYAVNRLPFVKASCRSLSTEQVKEAANGHHPFVAFFTSFARAKAAACWLSERGEEAYVHRFRANRIIEGRWHPIRPGTSVNHPTQMCHYAAAGVAFRDWPVHREQAADLKSGLPHRESISAFLVGLNADPAAESQYRHYNFYTLGVFTSEMRAKACMAERGCPDSHVSMWHVCLNQPLTPCLSSDILSARETRLLVRGAMMFIDQHEQWEREGGVISHVMARICDLVLDNHRHPEQSKPFKRARSTDSAALLEECSSVDSD